MINQWQLKTMKNNYKNMSKAMIGKPKYQGKYIRHIKLITQNKVWQKTPLNG